jgi:hypothetical protein
MFICTKLSTACKFACGICELHATPIMFCNTAGRNLYLQMAARLKNPLTILDAYTGQLRPIQPNHFQADLIWCDSTFKGRRGAGKLPGCTRMGWRGTVSWRSITG